jgi:hypothetical protein
MDARQLIVNEDFKNGDEASVPHFRDSIPYLSCLPGLGRSRWRVLVVQKCCVAHPARYQSYSPQRGAGSCPRSGWSWQSASSQHTRQIETLISFVSNFQTSLLSAIVGDMRKTEGTVKATGSVAYAPQNPWQV